MDPITHGIAGALLGKGYFSKRQNRHVAYSLQPPSGSRFSLTIDSCITQKRSRFCDPLAIVKYHRAFTHSFVGLPLFAILLAWITRRITCHYRIESPSWAFLTFIYGVGIASHILLDGMTSFGTRMWYPISSKRVAWDLLFIIDFTFSAVILVPQVIAWIYASGNSSRHLAFQTVCRHVQPAAAARSRMWVLIHDCRGCGVVQWEKYPNTDFILRRGPHCRAPFSQYCFLHPSVRIDGGFVCRAQAWCRGGTVCDGFVFGLTACGVAHHAAMRRVENFASTNHIEVERIGALPVPPSLFVWGDMVRSE